MLPLITFGICCYKQEAFIREALAGAFAQTYSPLEIIISDDFSPDGTFDIIRDMVDSYAGPHKITINRNEQNLGLGGNLNRLMELSHGEIFIAAAGDDVSLPERAEMLYRAFAANPDVYSVWSSVIRTAPDGAEKGRWILPTRRIGCLDFCRTHDVLGCSHAWRRESWSKFAVLPSRLLFEDTVMAMRSSLLGGCLVINAPLVKYRITPMSIMESCRQSREAELRRFLNLQNSYIQIYCDIVLALNQGFIDDRTGYKALNMTLKRIQAAHMMISVLHGGPRKIGVLMSGCLSNGIFRVELARLIRRVLKRRRGSK